MMAEEVNNETTLLINSNENERSIIDGDSNNNYRGNNRSQNDSLGFFAVVFLTVNATLGVGLLNIPYSFNNSGGIIYAITLQTVNISYCI